MVRWHTIFGYSILINACTYTMCLVSFRPCDTTDEVTEWGQRWVRGHGWNGQIKTSGRRHGYQDKENITETGGRKVKNYKQEFENVIE